MTGEQVASVREVDVISTLVLENAWIIWISSFLGKGRPSLFRESSCFNRTKEHIDLGIKYDPGTGIYGMDFYVHLSRPSSRVKNRKLKVGKVGCAHKLKKEDGMKWFQTKYDGILLN